MTRRIAILAVLLLSAPGAGAADLPDPCYDPDRPWPVHCEPLDEGRVALGDMAVLYQAYSFYEDLAGEDRPPKWIFDLTPAYRISGIRVYDEAGRPLLRVEHNVGEAWIEPPILVDRTPDAPLLVVSAGFAGTGSIREDHVFRRDGRRWTPIAASPWPDGDAGGWGAGLEARLPPGHGVWKGMIIDYATLTATTPVWRDGDANCCPTGGTAAIRFAIEGDALVITDVVHDPTAAP